MNLKRLKLLDKYFLLVLALIMVFGLVTLSSASSGITSDSNYYLKKQAIFLVVGIVIAIFILRFDYTQLEKYSTYLYILSLLILVVVLVFGKEVRGTTGWIGFGSLPPMQPAEFTKILLIVAFADFLQRRKGELNTLAQIFPCILYMGAPFILIMMQPDLGTALVYIAITVIMMFVAGANPRLLLQILVGGSLFIALLLFLHFKFNMWLPLDDYQFNRLKVVIDPYQDGQGGRGAGWNTIQSLIAIGSGGWQGKGLFNGTQVQLNFLPERHTDFIYAVIGEELGFLGAALVILLFGILLVRAVVISFNARELYGTLVVTGITAMWLFHIFENIGMSIGVMPITGIPLPFISYGGSSMLTNMIGVGLILSVNIRGKKIVF
ncbi:MAG: rod shape-determining protein RodA [Firmicutes bacterium HGW-Firmicutes-15]|nr:MAG: rod shape-determining protein RodA [Firmicutes bacterium HGW-Firmicutes-15]